MRTTIYLPDGLAEAAKVREWAMHDRGLRSNLVPDAYLGALAVTHGAKLATADRGFSRFPDVELVLPV